MNSNYYQASSEWQKLVTIHKKVMHIEKVYVKFDWRLKCVSSVLMHYWTEAGGKLDGACR